MQSCILIFNIYFHYWMDRRFLLGTSRLAAAVFTSYSWCNAQFVAPYFILLYIVFRFCVSSDHPPITPFRSINSVRISLTRHHCKSARCAVHRHIILVPIFPSTSYDRLERVQQMMNKYLIYLLSWNLISSFVLKGEYTFRLWTVDCRRRKIRREKNCTRIFNYFRITGSVKHVHCIGAVAIESKWANARNMYNIN